MDQIKITERTLNVKKVFRDKAPQLSRWIPGFVMSFIRRKIHEKELNEFLYQNKDKEGLEFIAAAIKRLGVKFEVIGLENIPKSGKQTLAANHPLGGPEGIGLLHILGEIRQDLTFLANDILMTVPNLRSLFTPVNKHGSNTEYYKKFNETFESDKLVLIFPSGLVSRRTFGKIEDPIWKSTFISTAIRNDREIIPCFIEGKNSNFFYNLANFRKRFKIKANLEMFLLADEMFKQEGNTIRVIFGKPVSNKMFDSRFNKHKWSAVFKEYVYKLKDDPSLVFNDDYLNSSFKF